MNIAFRTDSSYKIGTGHVHRCLNLARKFKKKKIKCYFFSNNYPGNINDLIKDEFELLTITNKNSKKLYLEEENKKDAKNTIKFIKKLKIDLIFLDSYLIKEDWELKIAKFCKIVLISDFLDRKSFCDYYLNYNLFYENKNINKNLKKNCIKLIGPDYSISKDFPNLKIKKKNIKKITVFMGGVDAKDYTSKIISILKHKFFLKYKKIIVIGQRNKKINILIKQIKNFKNFEIIFGIKKNLYTLFFNSNLVITNLGTAMYEHLMLGLKSVVIAQNSNQRKVMKNMSSYNLINFIKNRKEINSNYINKILNQKIFFKKKHILIDLFKTKGTDRIIDFFINQNIIQKAKLVKASLKDTFFLYKLVNDPLVIKNSLGNKFISFNKHKKWFQKTMQKKNSKIFIFKSIRHKLGQIRFDNISKNKTFITYSVSNEFRGKNVGYKMLYMALKKNFYKTPIYAIVKKNNEASNKIFKKLGFVLLKNYMKNNLIYYLKNN